MKETKSNIKNSDFLEYIPGILRSEFIRLASVAVKSPEEVKFTFPFLETREYLNEVSFTLKVSFF